jgi:predicted phage terminase large subunit-like protein
MVNDVHQLRAMLALTVLNNEFIPQSPTPRQAEFILLDEELEAMYGGAAAGGKSSCLLMAALQYVNVPGYNALILRRSFADLNKPGALMERAHDWLGHTTAKWNANDKRWTFPSGATLSFGYMANDKDRYQYQGSEFQFVGFDELTQFSEVQYKYLFSRVRKLEGSRIPIRIRSATNPGGTGHAWVYQRYFIEKEAPFVGAKIDDNPYVNATEYREALSHLDPVTREQLLNGDWEVRDGTGMFERDWFKNPIQLADVPKEALNNAVRFWDLAATPVSEVNKDPDWTVGTLVGEYAGIYYVLDQVKLRGTPQQVEALVHASAIKDGMHVRVWMEQEPGSSGVNTIDHYRRNVLRGCAFFGERATGSKQQRAMPLSSASEAGNVRFIQARWNRELLDELVLFPTKGVHDDQVDSLAGAFNKASKPKPGSHKAKAYAF